MVKWDEAGSSLVISVPCVDFLVNSLCTMEASYRFDKPLHFFATRSTSNWMWFSGQSISNSEILSGLANKYAPYTPRLIIPIHCQLLTI